MNIAERDLGVRSGSANGAYSAAGCNLMEERYGVNCKCLRTNQLLPLQPTAVRFVTG